MMSMPEFSKKVMEANKKRAGTTGKYIGNFLLKVDGQATSFNELVSKMELDEEGAQRLRNRIKTIRSNKNYSEITMAKLLTIKGN